MLVFNRKREESIMIGDTEVMIVDIRRDKVQLGITASKDIPVHRREVYDKIQKEKKNGKS